MPTDTLPAFEIAAGVLVAGYLLGSVPFGLVLTRLAGYGDIRQIGSGNIGATNVLRTGNKPLAAATLVLDSGKGAAAALIAAYFFGPVAGLIAGVAAVFGHNFPVWLGFKGGKGVATTLGVLVAMSWFAGLAACAAWLAVAAVTRYSSLSSILALAAAPVAAWYLVQPNVAVAALVLAVLGWIRHGANIQRLLAGQEPKIGRKTA